MPTLRQHLRHDHDYDRISRGFDVQRLHEMDHARILREKKDWQDHDHADVADTGFRQMAIRTPPS